MIREGADKMIKNNTIKVILALIFAGALFFSCDINDSETGVLIIDLPGSSARTLQDYFIKSLRYEVVCVSGSSEKKGIFSHGDRASFILAPGKWHVTLNVLDINDRIKGFKEEDVVIRAGKHESVSFNNIEITDLNGKNVLLLNITTNNGGFDIIHIKTDGTGTTVDSWNKVIPIEFKPGDKITIRGLYPANSNAVIQLLPFSFSPEVIDDPGIGIDYKRFSDNLTLDGDMIAQIAKHHTTGGANLNAPNGIRIKLSGSSTGSVYIEQLLITRVNGEILLDFSDHLQTFSLNNETNGGGGRLEGIFSNERHLIGANTGSIIFKVCEWKEFLK